MFTEFDKRMKSYERDYILIPRLPFIVRIDGRAFHTFCHNLDRPYHSSLSFLMQQTTIELIKEFSPILGYTQSDEISLLFYNSSFLAQPLFGGKICKICSVMASYTAAIFTDNLRENIPEKDGYTISFDARVFNMPDLIETGNYFIWREKDAVRNSISMAAQSQFSHKELQNKKCSEMQDMLFERGINWNDYPEFFKRGSYYKPVKNEGLRTEIARKNWPILTKISNLADVLIKDVTPELKDESKITK